MRFFRATGIMLLGLALMLGGCGGGGSSMTPPATMPSPQPQSASSTVGVSIGDAPADWMLVFGMTVNSITLTSDSGQSVSLLAAPTSMEMMQLMGGLRPLAIASVPQGTYTQATLTLSAMLLGYMDPNTRQYVERSVPGPVSGTVAFTPGLVVGSTSAMLAFDMDMEHSVAIDSTGVVTVTPHFSGGINPVSTAARNPWDGWMQHMVGAVAGVSGSQFTMNMMMGVQKISFTTNASTQFDGLGGMNMMGQGMIVEVDAALQADGSLLAQRIAALQGNGGMMGSGIVQSISGNPPSQLMMAANDGIGGGMRMSAISGTIAVNASSSTPCSFDADGVDLTNLPFTPVFDCAHMGVGQSIQVISGGSMMGGGMGGGMMGGGLGTINASQIMLEQQALRGTVSSYAANGGQASFMLALSPDSAFALLTGKTSILVYQQAGTQMRGLSAIGNGQELQVRGLLFNDGGTYKMVATWMMS